MLLCSGWLLVLLCCCKGVVLGVLGGCYGIAMEFCVDGSDVVLLLGYSWWLLVLLYCC